MLHVGILPHHAAWGDLFANLAFVVVDEAHVYRGVFGSHVANVLRRLRRAAALYGSSPRFLLASATIANPVELGPGPHRPARDQPRRQRHRAAARPPRRDLEPAAARRAAGRARLGAGRGGRAAGRADHRRRPHDLLHEVAQGRRADPAHGRRPAGARAGRAHRPLPRRLHAPAAPRDRGAPGQRRAARRGRHRRARARDRHRRARRRDLRHLPRHGRQPAPDVGSRRAPRPRPGRLRRRRGRARSVLRPSPRGVPQPARSRRRSSTPSSPRDPRRAPALRRARGAAHRGRRRVLRRTT